MKNKLVLYLILLFVCIESYAQGLPNLKEVKLNKKSHYKTAEETTRKVVNYLFETPINKHNRSRAEAGQFLLEWMHGTPDYTFYLEEKETNFFNTDSDLILMYMAALTKFVLENPSVTDQKLIVIGALKLALSYLNNQEDKKSWSLELWQLNDAYQKGKLEDYLHHRP